MPALTIAKAAAGTDKPAKPYEVRARAPVGLLLRVQPSGSRTFYVQVSRGKRVRLGPAGVWTLEKAKTQAAEILRDPAAHAAKKAAGVTLAEYIEDPYREHALAHLKNGARSVARVLSVWSALLHKRLDTITAAEVARMRTKRLAAGVAPATINRDVAALSGVFSHWQEHAGGRHPLAGFAPLKVADDETVRYLKPDEAQRLRDTLAARDREAAAARRRANEWRAARGRPLLPEIVGYCDHMTPMVLLTLNTGLRAGELFSLTWAEVDLDRRVLTVLASHAKGNATRHIPLNDEAQRVLATIKPEKAEGLVFRSPISGERFDNVKKAWAEITKAAGVPRTRWHDLRHDFASQLVMRGVPLYTVQKLLGHANAKMTQRYAKLAPEALADAVALLAPVARGVRRAA